MNYFSTTLIALAMSVSLLTQTANAAEESATIVCKIGDGMISSFLAYYSPTKVVDVTGKTVFINAMSQKPTHTLTFTRYGRKTNLNGDGLPKGSCAFIDRGMVAQDSNQLVFTVTTWAEGTTVIQQNGSSGQTSTNMGSWDPVLPNQDGKIFRVDLKRYPTGNPWTTYIPEGTKPVVVN